MGKALIVYRIYPAEGANMDELEKALKKVDKVIETRREPIAFGLELIRVGALIDDKKDKPEEVEKAIESTKGVGQIETEDVTLIS